MKKCIYLTFSETFLVFLVPLVVFFGVKFGFRKSCQCKRNDKYEVWCIDASMKAGRTDTIIFIFSIELSLETLNGKKMSYIGGYGNVIIKVE